MALLRYGFGGLLSGNVATQEEERNGDLSGFEVQQFFSPIPCFSVAPVHSHIRSLLCCRPSPLKKGSLRTTMEPHVGTGAIGVNNKRISSVDTGGG